MNEELSMQAEELEAAAEQLQEQAQQLVVQCNFAERLIDNLPASLRYRSRSTSRAGSGILTGTFSIIRSKALRVAC